MTMPEKERREGRIFLASVCALLLVGLVASDFIVHKHPHFPVEEVPGFYAWLGLGAVAALAFLARLAGLVLQSGADQRPDQLD